MQSIEIKNWLTGLIIGIIGLFLTASGVAIAYKQLRRTKKRADDIEASNAENIVLHDAPVSAHETKDTRVAGMSTVVVSDAAQVQRQLSECAVADRK